MCRSLYDTIQAGQRSINSSTVTVTNDETTAPAMKYRHHALMLEVLPTTINDISDLREGFTIVVKTS